VDQKELNVDKILFIVESNCADPAKEEAFNEWYNKTHLPDVLESPEVLRAVRYQRMDTSGGQAKYLALYEIETDDFPALMKSAEENREKIKAAGRWSDLLQITARDALIQIYSLSK
jgi:hypothetical protein